MKVLKYNQPGYSDIPGAKVDEEITISTDAAALYMQRLIKQRYGEDVDYATAIQEFKIIYWAWECEED